MFNFIPQRNLRKNSVFLTILFLAATRHKSVCMIVPGCKQVVLGLKHFVLPKKQIVQYLKHILIQLTSESMESQRT